MIFLILFLALILRLIGLNQSLWLDEAVQAITAQNNLGYIFQEITGDFHPPLYYFLMHFWVRIFGNSEIALRMPSVIFGVGAVYFVYKISGLWKEDNEDLTINKWIAALFMATASFHIYYSQEARMYAMATFLVAGSFYFLLRALKSGKGNRGLYFLFILLALYTDYYAWLAFLVQGIYLLIRKKYKYLILNTVFLILFYLPWLPMFFTQIKTGMLATKMLPEWGRLVNVSFIKAIPLTLVKFIIGRITIFDKRTYGVVAASLIAGCSWLMINGLKKRLGEVKGMIAMWFFVPLGASWLVSLFIPNYQPFRLLLILPAFYLLLAGGIQGFRSSAIRRIIIVLILSINLASLSVYYFNPYFQREDWKGLTAFLKKEQKATVLLPSSASNWPIKYYDQSNKVKMAYGVNGAMQISEADSLLKEGNKQLYYIRYLVSVFDPQEKILASLEKEGYTKIKERSFNQILVWEFQKR